MYLPKSFKLPQHYVLASMLCSFGGFLFGMDTGIIGPVTVMKSFDSQFGPLSATVHGLVVSSILIPAAISSVFAGRLADVLGRPIGIAIGAAIFGCGAALEAGAVRLAMFIVGRVIEGLGEGLYMGTLVVYICEISPPRQRGPLATGPQLLITLGLMVGYFVCYASANMGSSISWRLPFTLLACFSLVFSMSSFFWLTPSPRWLTIRGRRAEASAAWDKLGVGHAEREKAENEQSTELRNSSESITAINQQDIGAAPSSEGPPAKDNFLDVFKRDVRTRTGLAVFLMGMQQLSGIDGVLYYAPLLFEQAGLASGQAAFLASGVSAIVIFAVTVPATMFSDKWGRRQSTIYGGTGLAATMFLMGALYAGDAVHKDSGGGRWIVIVTIYLFSVVYCSSWAVGIKVYAAEIQPQRTRASATSLAHGSNWASNFLVALVTPVLLQSSSFGAYFLFGGCSLFTAVACAMFMPETKGRSLDEIEDAFKSNVPGTQNLAKAVRRILGRNTASFVA